ncbi:sensor histidine kinase [Stenotrophobium rhamnosiphilum]|uniref:histidine kinase n=2 Tax=Stenotrophobium rhamnosiphilum TaxID=2029166 RepID=A0A2T5MG07_9GAMM|nr:sensor histidine kinase [Stenotrophobium rhamnosiphilum]
MTLMISALVMGRIARENYTTLTPDWHDLASDTAAIYDAAGIDAVASWARPLQRRGIQIALLENGRNLLMSPLPPPMEDSLPRLMRDSEIILHPKSDVTLVGLDVVSGDRTLRFLAMRAPPRGAGPRFFSPRGQLPMLIEILVSLFVIGVVSWLIARSMGKPVEQLQRAVRRVAAGDLSARIGAPLAQSKDELGQLARDFDHMANRIESLVERNRWLLRDISHELRSPLARLQLALELGRGEAQSTVQPYFERASREIVRLDELIAEMLALSRAEEGAAGMAPEAVDLAEMARDRLAEAQIELDNRGLKASLDAPETAVLEGHSVLLGRALDNLISNAIKFSPAGSEIQLRVAALAQSIEISVEDRGPGVPEAELPQLFSPFYRGSNGLRANGQGLGLAIVERIVQVHGGRCLAANREGGGLSMTLILPVAAKA